MTDDKFSKSPPQKDQGSGKQPAGKFPQKGEPEPSFDKFAKQPPEKSVDKFANQPPAGKFPPKAEPEFDKFANQPPAGKFPPKAEPEFDKFANQPPAGKFPPKGDKFASEPPDKTFDKSGSFSKGAPESKPTHDSPDINTRGGFGGLSAGASGNRAAAANPAQSAADPQDMAQIQQQADTLQMRYRQLIDKVSLSAVSRRIIEIGSKVSALKTDIADVRRRGYVYGAYLEDKSDVLANDLENVQEQLNRTLESEIGELRGELDEVEGTLQSMSRVANDRVQLGGFVQMADVALGGLEQKVTAAEQNLSGMYGPIENEIYKSEQQLQQINWYLEQKDQASFDFADGESVYMVAEAKWKDGRDEPEGFLFLTDHRLVFEQRQVTGKTLGLFGGKTEHEVEWEAPLSSIESVTTEEQGLFGSTDLLKLKFGAGARFAEAAVETKGNAHNDEWARQIRRMSSGNVTDERAVPPDPALIERLRNAPTECPVCGGVLPQINTGQTSVTCKYCGAVHRI